MHYKRFPSTTLRKQNLETNPSLEGVWKFGEKLPRNTNSPAYDMMKPQMRALALRHGYGRRLKMGTKIASSAGHHLLPARQNCARQNYLGIGNKSKVAPSHGLTWATTFVDGFDINTVFDSHNQHRFIRLLSTQVPSADTRVACHRLAVPSIETTYSRN